jgi:hypothetical protein
VPAYWSRRQQFTSISTSPATDTYPTIGVLFLLQVIAAFLLGLLVLALSRPVVALAGAGFAASTLGGYILSLWIGLFGFNEVRTTAGIVAGVVEVAAFIALSTYALVFAPLSNSG